MAKAYLVGSGIAALAAATFLIRDGQFDGGHIHLFEQQERTGGSLDAGGTPEAGYTMRGGRMFEAEFRCTYDLLSTIPTLEDPSVSVTEDILAAYEEFGWDDAARLVDADGKITDVRSMGFSERDRLELVKCLATPEGMLDGRKITDCFGEHFFTTNFWYMWCTTFAFQPWHSAMEFRRYLKRFIHLFPSFASMTGIQRTRYNQYDSIVRPLQAWLAERGVTVHTGCSVTDLDLAPGSGTRVEGIRLDRRGRHERIHVAPQDLVLITNGSMTDSSSLGSHTTAPPPHPRRSDAWLLWHRLARGRDDFGNPDAFDKNIPASQWESFTVTATDPSFLDALEKFSGREAGKGGLMTFTASNWLLTVVANHQPVYRDQPNGVTVWWGYGLYPDRPGNRTGKPMTACTGREILQEVLHHLHFDQELTDRVLATSTVVPCLMPYITSQFLTRRRDDRPHVVPEGSVNLAFIGQFAEVPDDVVFTVEYSVRTAWTAVAELLGLDRRPPEVYKGHHDPHVLVEALETMHRR
ncbi:oleate hydratase [Streptomyces ipomoeae]|uniref:oleate hydratase n=1 Tax=Streptomyces ipomoeae TaxID=103232 RepID=UPI0029BCD066|nr:oleate hydratase [Streptomyces ipomoeae]MDX2820868.1 oleate hydratase [Streptomyces ipomoeae]MDX2873307.1 oleate hydratase [Streptomyces ipomoeae]